MLIGLKQPLKDGDRFPMTLRFEKAGEREVMVWVQTPRGGAGVHPHQH
jgi:copper(I)-binding protein